MLTRRADVLRLEKALDLPGELADIQTRLDTSTIRSKVGDGHRAV